MERPKMPCDVEKIPEPVYSQSESIHDEPEDHVQTRERSGRYTWFDLPLG